MIKDKIIHQIWFQDNTFKLNYFNSKYYFNKNLKHIIKKIKNAKIPIKYKNNAITWIINNKDWKYILWNSSMIDIFLYTYYPNLLPIYKSFNLMILKIDFIKYVILYHYGGIYCDIDTIALKSINPLIKYYNNSNIILTKVPPFNKLERACLDITLNIDKDMKYLNNGIIISNKHHPFWLDIIHNISKTKDTYPDFLHSANVFNRTGPLMLMNTYKNHKYDDIALAKYVFLEPCYGYDLQCKPKPISFAIHYHDSNWLYDTPKNSYISTKLMYFWYKNMLPVSSNIYFRYIRDYKRLILSFAIICLIYIIYHHK